jgi:hypothetical protein
MFLSSGGGLNAASLNNLGGAAVNNSKTILQAHLGNNLSAVSFVAGNANVVNDTLGTGNWKFYVAPSTSIAAITGASNSTEWTVGNLLSYSSGSSPILNYSFDPSTKSGSTIKNLATNDYGLTLTNGATIKPRDLYSTQNAGSYIINGQTNPTLTFHRGYTYRIVTGHVNYPMYIQTVPAPYSSGNVYNTGVTNNGTGTLVITIVVTNDTPSTLYYTHAGGTIGTGSGTINIVASGEPDTVLSMNVSSGQYATSSVPLSFSQPWTISFVYQFTGTFNGDPTIFEIGNATGFGLRIAGGNSARSIISYQNGTVFSSQSYASSNSNSYNHYALVYNNGSFTGYFNATTSVTFQGSPQLNVVSDYTYINFGKSNMSSVTNPTTGTRVIEIDNFQIFNSALSLSDITALYNGTYVSPPPTLNDTTTSTTWMPTPGTLVDSTETLYTVKSNEIALKPGTNSTYAVWTATKSTNLKIDVSFADYNSRSANGVGFQMFKIKADNTFDSVLFPRTVTSTALTNANSSNYLTVPSINTTVNAGDKIYYRVDANGTTTSASSILATTIFTDAVSVASNPVENKLLQAQLATNLNAATLVAGNANTVLDTLGSGDWKFYVAPSTSIASITAASAVDEWTGGSILPYVLPPSVPTDMAFWYTMNSNKVTSPTINDSVGNYAGTLFGSPVATIATDGSPGPGQGYLLLSSASSQYATLPTFTTGSVGLSFSFWFRSNASVDYVRFFQFSNGTNNNVIDFGIALNKFYNNTTTGTSATGSNVSEIGTTSINDNVWRHVVFIFHPTNGWTLYLNGVLDYTNPTGTYPTATSRTVNYLGRTAGSTLYYNGGIDDFRFYNRAITAEEVTLIYSQPAIYFPLNVADINPSVTTQVGEYSTGSYVYNGILTRATIAVDGNSRVSGQGYLSVNGLSGTSGSAQYLTLPTIRLTQSTGFSISLWVYPYLNNDGFIFDFRSASNGDNFMLACYNDSSSKKFVFYPYGTDFIFTENNSMTYDKWNHVCITISPTNFTTIYVDSVSRYSNTPTANAFSGDNAKTLAKLGSTYLGNNGLGGGIDDFRIYHRPLSQAEVSALYAGPQPPSLKDVGTGVTWITKPAIPVDATETSYTVKSNEIALKPGINSTYAVWTSPKSTNLKIDVSFADYHSRSTSGVGFQMFKINRDNTFGSVIFGRTTTSTALTNANPTNYLSVPSRTISVATGDKIYYRIDGNGAPTLASSVLATNIYVDPNQDLKQNTILQAHLGNNLTATTFVAGNANIVNDTLGTGNWKFYVAPSTSIAAITGASNSTEWTVGNLLSYSLPSTPPVNYSIFYPFDSDSFSGTNVGNKATGSYVNDAVLTSSATISTSQYKYGTASLYLNNPTGGGSASQHLKLPTFTISQSTGFSVSLWVYNVRSALDATFLFDFSTSGSGTGSNNMMLNLTGTNRYQFYSNYSSNSGGVITSNTEDVRKLNQWSHVCITINTSNFTTIYVDLVSVYSGTPAGSAFAGGAKTSAMLGATYFGNKSFYGYIDDFKIYNRPLTLAEVTALYTGPSPAKLSDTGATWMPTPGTPVDSTETLYTVKSNEVALTPGTNSTYAVWTATKSTNLKIDVSFADYNSRSANGVGFQMFKIKSDNTLNSVLFPRTVTSTALTNAAPSNYLTIPSINTTVTVGDKIYYRVDGNGISTSASSVLATAIYTDAVSVATNPVETKLVQAQLATNLSNASLVAGNANTILDTAGAGDWKFYVAPSTSIAAITSASASSEWTGGSVLPYVLPPSVPTDMSFCFTFNSNAVSGTTVSSSVGGYTGTLMNNAVIVTDGSPGPGNGYALLTKVNNSPSGYIVLPVLTFTTFGLTISMWFRATTNNVTFARLFDMYPFTIHINSSPDGIGFNGGGISNGTIYTGTVRDNVWRHLAVTITNSGASSAYKCYINGTLQQTTTSSYINLATTYQQSTIGTVNSFGGSGGAESFDGGIDDFRVYHRPITAEEVLLIYSQPAIYFPFDVADVSLSAPTKVGDLATGSYVYSGTLTASTTPPSSNATIVVDSRSRVSGKGYLSLVKTNKSFFNFTPFGVVTSGLTIAMWFRATTSNESARLFDMRNPEISLTVTPTALSLYVTPNTIFAYTFNFRDNVWRHVALTITYAGTSGASSVYRLYVDGVVQRTSSPVAYPALGNRSFSGLPAYCLGTAVNGNSDAELFDGGIDDFRVYQRTLSPEEVTALYAGPQPPSLKDTVTGATWLTNPATPVDATETSYTVKSNEIALKPGANSTYAIWTSPKTTNIRLDVSFADYHSRSASGVGFQIFKINSDNTFGSVIFPRTTTVSALTDLAPTNYLTVPSTSLSVATGDKVVYRIDGNGAPTLASSVLATNIYSYSGRWT